MNRHASDPVIQILAEFLGIHHLLEIAIGRADQTNVHLDRIVAAEPNDLAILQHAEQFRLHGARHVADLIHEERSAIRVFESAFALGLRAGEGALRRGQTAHLQECFRSALRS